MLFNSQKEAISSLESLAHKGRQSILIAGPSGCGKSYLSKQYANMLEIDDFYSVAPKVADIREAIDSCSAIQNNVLLCIENLDKGVSGASYTILKSLEEPLPHLYIVITCRSTEGVPDTIISRSAVITLGPPTPADINSFGEQADFNKYQVASKHAVWNSVKSFNDATAVLGMSLDELNYYDTIGQECAKKDSISSLSWKISHYDSSSPSNIELSIRSIIGYYNNPFITRCGIECIRDLTQGRIAQHAVLSKFLFNLKYGE